MKRTKKGSLSVFAALSLMLIAAFLFVLLEAGRAAEMRKLARINTESVLESVFAGFDSALWDDYRLLAFDAYGSADTPFLLWEAETEALSNENLAPVSFGENIYGNNLLQMKAMEASFDQYRYLTDDDGKAFEAAASAYMKNNLLMEAAQQIYGQFEAVSEMLEEEESGQSAVEDALTMLEEAKSGSGGDASTGTGEVAESAASGFPETEGALGAVNKEAADGTEDGIGVAEAVREPPEENPLEVATKLQSMGILELVLEDTSKVSTSSVTLSETVSHRPLQSGICAEPVDVGWLDYVLMQQYLVKYLGNYTDVKENRALDYELEYLLCGKAGDVENLKGTVNRIMLIREAANLLYLTTDAAKQSLALEIATALAGATANPAIIEVVKWGILAAWAYAESVLDLRALLDGDKVSLIKKSSEWTSDIEGLATSLDSFAKAKSCETGLSYSSYVGLLLFFQGEKNLAYRGMDMIEASIQKQEGKEDFYMDHMAIDAQLTMNYCYHTIFFGMESLTEGKDRYYQVRSTAAYSYRRAGV